jgi:dipeptidyl aminopeptidase/acylaminoacyl peptidase
VDVATGATRLLTPQPGAWSGPVLSPDGRTVAYRGYPETRASYQAAALWVMPLGEGGQRAARKVSGAQDDDPARLFWAPDGRGLYYARQPARHVERVVREPRRRRAAARTTGAHLLSLILRGQWRAGRRRRALRRPGAARRVRIGLRDGRATRLTAVNETCLAHVTLGAVTPIEYASTGGTRVQGVDRHPARLRLDAEVPAHHGDPRRAARRLRHRASTDVPELRRAGLPWCSTPNPRGSTGYGSPSATPSSAATRASTTTT